MRLTGNWRAYCAAEYKKHVKSCRCRQVRVVGWKRKRVPVLITAKDVVICHLKESATRFLQYLGLFEPSTRFNSIEMRIPFRLIQTIWSVLDQNLFTDVFLLSENLPTILSDKRSMLWLTVRQELRNLEWSF